jgi:NAD-dependent deacetylase
VREAICMNCYRVVPAESYWTKFISDGDMPLCPACRGVLKPNVTLFGEALPAQALLAATQAARRCDVMLVAGSSLEVSPAADLPELALANRARLIIVNLTRTHMDECADVVIHEDVAQVLPRIADRIEVAQDASSN